MPANISRVRCSWCRMWIDAPRGAATVPGHKDLATGNKCPGSGRAPAERRGPQ